MALRLSDHRPLSELIPEPDRFWADPAAALARAPVVIGPFRPVVATVACAWLCAALAVVPEFYELEWGGYVFFRGLIPVVAGVLLALHWWPGQEMVLDRVGLEIRRGRRVIRCPWALFAAPGTPDVVPLFYLRLPCRLQVVPWIEHYRDGCFVGYGTSAANGALSFRPGGALLDARFEMTLRDVGTLLLRLARHLGDETPFTGPPPGGEANVAAAPDMVVRPSGWFVFRRDVLRLPRFCCRCDRPADAVLKLSVSDRLSKYLGWLAHYRRWVDVEVPICRACRARTWRIAIGGGLVAAIGAIALMIHELVFDPAFARLDTLEIVAAATVGALPFGLLGGYLVWRIVNGRFVQAGTFAEDRDTVTIRFRQPDFVRRLLDADGVRGTRENEAESTGYDRAGRGEH